MLSETEAAARLTVLLTQHGAATCPQCGHPIGLGDVAWNNGGNTDSGTPYSVVEIQCTVCDTEIARSESWYPEITDYAELLYVLEKDWGRII